MKSRGRPAIGITNEVECDLCERKFKRYKSYDNRRKNTFCSECWKNRRRECFVIMGKSADIQCERCGEWLIVGKSQKNKPKTTRGWLLCKGCRKAKDEEMKKYRGSTPHSILMHKDVYKKIQQVAKRNRMTIQQVIDESVDLFMKEGT